MPVSALINRHLFTTRVFDSGALTVLTSVIHQFSDPGVYFVTIRRGDAVLGTSRFQVSADSTATQLNVDLAVAASPGAVSAFVRRAGAPTKDCNCGGSHAMAAAGSMPAGPASVSPRGYVQFFVSQGEGGLSASVAKEGGDKLLFDTAMLGSGDMFALSLLVPAAFNVVNKAGTASATITVSFSKDVARNLKGTAPVHVDASKSAFAPNDIQLSSGQGLVFRVKDAARVVITQEPGTAMAMAPPRKAARTFRRLRPLAPRKP